MSRIVKAVNKMISNAGKITGTFRSHQTYYFEYDNKYAWCIYQTVDSDYVLDYYPGNWEIDDLLTSIKIDPESVDSVSYNTRMLKTRETIESFAELYSLVKEMHLGINSALDDIIGT